MSDVVHQFSLPGLSILDASDAPPGYLAVLKTDACPKDSNENCCRFCDWRPECQKGSHAARCMPYPAVLQDGSLWERKDGCSVVFKKIEAENGPVF